MILLDTHVWVWWVQGDDRISPQTRDVLDSRLDGSTAVSAMSCWEVAMLHERGRLEFGMTLDEWLDTALKYPGVRLLNTDRITLVESCRLLDFEHRDPVDRILVATAQRMDWTLVTADRVILSYSRVSTVKPKDLWTTDLP